MNKHVKEEEKDMIWMVIGSHNYGWVATVAMLWQQLGRERDNFFFQKKFEP